MQTITDVIARLDAIVQECMQNQSRAGYFAALYKRMTMAVASGITTGAFEDGPRMERLDIIFAGRYLDAYSSYMAGNACSASWKIAFDATKGDGLIVLQHLLLGINAHINLDLAIAAAACCPGDTITGLQNDFMKINQVIGSLVNDVQQALTGVWPPMAVLGAIANGTQDAVLNFSIDKARDVSWANAGLLARMSADRQPAYIQRMDAATAGVARGVQDPGILFELVLKTIRATEYDNTARTIGLIETAVV